jgi:TATA-box binding protein (TBP) (component of TFIID and TFIIIB)
MMEEGRIVVGIETQTFKFTATSPINHHDAVSLAGGTVSGPYVVVSHEQPRATFIIEPDGSVLVHGIARAEVARIAMQELLLTLGMPEENLTMEMGGMLIRFNIGRAVMLELAAERFADIELDDRLGALRINAALHNAQILLFNNGLGVVLGQSSKKIAEMAVRHWAGLLNEEGVLE